MKTLLKYLFRFCLLVLVLAFAAWWFIDWSVLNRYASSRFQTFLTEKKIPVRFEKIEVGLPAFTVSSITITPPRFLYNFKIDSVTVTPAIREFLSGNPDFMVSAKLYGGEASVRLRQIGQVMKAERMLVKAIDVASHSALKNLGVSKALLNGSAEELILHGDTYTSGTGMVQLNEITIPTQNQFIAPGLPFPIIIPALSKGNASAQVQLDRDTVTVSNINFQSSLGTVRGTLVFTKSSGWGITASGSILQLTLTDEGFKSVGPFVQLLCPSKEVQANFELTFTFPKSKQAYVVCR